MKKIPVIAICGATASGKTGLAVRLAKEFGGEVISSDSRQIYKYMGIGTAKPTADEMEGIEHYLIDFVEPDDVFSVADYVELAHKCAAYIRAKDKTIIVAGGTGLYMDSFLNDVTFGEMDSAESLAERERLHNIANKYGREHLWRMLEEKDPASALRIHPNNVIRVVRALEFYNLTGKEISKHQEETKRQISRYCPVKLAVSWERETLYDRINKRVDIMLDSGLIEEVAALLKMGYDKNIQSMQGIGYKEVCQYLDGLVSYDEMAELIKRNSRRYAKRQYTWFNRDECIYWLSPENAFDEACDIIYKSKIYR